MGCGASSAVQIAPMDTDLSQSEATNADKERSVAVAGSQSALPVSANGYPPSAKPGFKSRLFHNKSQTTSSAHKPTDIANRISIAIQTDFSDLNGIKSQYSQTDIQLSAEEEMDLIISGTAVGVGGSGDEDSISASLQTPESDASDSEVNKSVLLQTEESVLSRKTRKELPLTGQVTIEVGIQVRPKTKSCATQTRFGFVRTHKTQLVPKASAVQSNLRKSMSVDTDHYRLWTAPVRHKSDHIDTTLDVITLNNSILQDIESQTDPKLSSVMAANSAGSDLSAVLHSYDISSPFAHIERELMVNMSAMNVVSKANMANKANMVNNLIKVPDGNLLQDCLTKLFDDMDDTLKLKANSVPKCDASVQTVNDILTDECPQFAARPPPSLKREMIPTLALFREIDRRAVEAPELESLQELVQYLCKSLKSDLQKVRAIFRWITHSVKFDFKYMATNRTAAEVFRSCEGVCKDYCLLFAEMCRTAGIRAKLIEGFAKGYDYRPGHRFKPGEDITHTWNAVFVSHAWRLIDPTWGTGYTDPSGKFQRKVNEHFFLTDPEVLIWTHFPYDPMENNYQRWQLLERALSLDEFNSLPKVSANFFEFNLKIRSKPQNPIVFRISTEVKIGSHEAMRYKYKLYPSDEMENSSLNHYVFCQLKEDRLVGSFAVTPPIEGRFLLKIFAKPERDMQEGQDSTSLQAVTTLVLDCTRARKYIEPLPINELPWGPTQTFYDYKLRLHNQTGPVITTWGGRRRLVMDSNETMLISYSIFDADGMEMDVRSIVYRDDTGNKTTFTISPPRVGTFKLMIFGMPKPKQKGKWRLPLLATFMVDCKLIKPPQYDEDPPPQVVVTQSDELTPQQRGGRRN